MTLYAARRDTRTLDALAPDARPPIDLARTATTQATARRSSDAPLRRSTTPTRRVTRLLPTGLW